MRQFTSDSLRNVAMFRFGGKDEPDRASSSDAPAEESTIKDEKQEEQTQPKTESQRRAPRRGLLRQFSYDSLRNVTNFGFGNKRSSSACDEPVTPASEDSLQTHKQRMKPHGARTRRGGRRPRSPHAELGIVTPVMEVSESSESVG